MGVDKKGSRDACRHTAQLRFQLVVHDEDGEVRPFSLALCLGKGQQLALDIPLQLRDGVTNPAHQDQRRSLDIRRSLTAVSCACHRLRPGKNVASTSRHRVTGTDHNQGTPAKEDLARLRASASQ